MRIRDEHKETIIREKAVEMIVKEGFDGLSMHKLAKEAGISPATIYLYFKNREDLLNQVFIAVEDRFAEITLKKFDPQMPFEDGLWLQWKNRFEHLNLFPNDFHFLQQFKNSPLINHCDIKESRFKLAMRQFFANAIARNEVRNLPVEVYWSLAYAPFYSLIKFHLGGNAFGKQNFELTETKMREAFELVIKALKN